MDFLKKAKKGLKEAQDLAEEFKGMNFGKKDHDHNHSSSNGSYPSQSNDHTTSYSDKQVGSAPTTTGSTPINTPATTVSGSSFKVNPKDLTVPHCTASGAPAKIALADRKKIRDDFEAKKPELEAEISKLLGAPWTIHVDTAGVYSYMNNDSSALKNPGLYIYNYFNGAIHKVKYFSEKYGASDAARINEFAPARIVTLEPTSDTNVNYASTDFYEGRWRLLFRDTKFGWNAEDAALNISDALNAASKSVGGASGKPEMSLNAKKSIRDNYESKVNAALDKARKWLAEPNLQFVPNFEENYATLAAFDATLDRSEREDNAKLRKDWENTLGQATLSYFEGFVSQLEWKKFKGDDMMQEAFKDVVSSNTVAFLVSNNISRNRNDSVIENGVLVIRTNPWNWWTNTNDATDQIDQLW